MIYPIVVYGNPSLRQPSKNIDKEYADLTKLLDDMYETMYSSDGIGLAAPQIGKNIRVFVIDASPLAEDDPELEDFKRIFINAQITERTGVPWNFNEGCLSLPDIREEVSRPERIVMTYLTENFEEKTEEFDGIKARIIQHEYDHLDGKLFIDYITPLRKRLIKNKLTAIEKGKISTSYRIRVYKK